MVILEEYFHLANLISPEVNGWFGVKYELPYQMLIVFPISLVVMIVAYRGVPPYLRRAIRIVAAALLVAWVFGGLVNAYGQTSDQYRAIQVGEKFGEMAAFSVAAGYAIAIASQLRRMRHSAALSRPLRS